MLTFAEIGLAGLVEVYGGAKRFDPNMSNHHHLHCISCGQIIDFNNDQYNNLEIPDDIRQRFMVLNSRVSSKVFVKTAAARGKFPPNIIF